MKYFVLFIFPLVLFATDPVELDTSVNGDLLEILREPTQPENQHLQPDLNPWTITSSDDYGVNADSGDTSGFFDWLWSAQNDGSFWDFYSDDSDDSDDSDNNDGTDDTDDNPNNNTDTGIDIDTNSTTDGTGDVEVNVEVNVNVEPPDLEALLDAINNMDGDEDVPALQNIEQAIINLGGKKWEIADDQWKDISNLYQYMTDEQKPELLLMNENLTKIYEDNKTIDELVKIQNQNEVSIGLSQTQNEMTKKANELQEINNETLDEFFEAFKEFSTIDSDIMDANLTYSEQVRPSPLFPKTQAIVDDFIYEVKEAIAYEVIMESDFTVTPKDVDNFHIVQVAGFTIDLDLDNDKLAGLISIGKIGITLLLSWGILVLFFKLISQMLAS